MNSNELFKIGFNVGVKGYGSHVELYDTRGYTAKRETMLNSSEMHALWKWYTDGLCPICLAEINVGQTVCDECYQDAMTYRETYDA